MRGAKLSAGGAGLKGRAVVILARGTSTSRTRLSEPPPLRR